MADDFGFGFDEAPAPEAPEAATAPAPAEEEEEFGMGFGEEVEAATAAVAEVKVADPEVGSVRVTRRPVARPRPIPSPCAWPTAQQANARGPLCAAWRACTMRCECGELSCRCGSLC